LVERINEFVTGFEKMIKQSYNVLTPNLEILNFSGFFGRNL